MTNELEVVVNWTTINNETTDWNLICADVVEVFGLPGHRFNYRPTVDFMTFIFKNKKDADLCKVLLSDRL
jgi:hypothetical protein